MTGMIEGFFGFEIFYSGMFLGRKINGKYFFGWLDLSRDFLGIQNNLKNCGSACVCWPRSFCEYYLLTTKLVLRLF